MNVTVTAQVTDSCVQLVLWEGELPGRVAGFARTRQAQHLRALPGLAVEHDGANRQVAGMVEGTETAAAPTVRANNAKLRRGRYREAKQGDAPTPMPKLVPAGSTRRSAARHAVRLKAVWTWRLLRLHICERWECRQRANIPYQGP